jgi:hypothetical protein
MVDADRSALFPPPEPLPGMHSNFLIRGTNQVVAFEDPLPFRDWRKAAMLVLFGT